MQTHSWKSVPVAPHKNENHLFTSGIDHSDGFKPLCGLTGRTHPILSGCALLDRCQVLGIEDKTAPYCQQCIDKE